MVEINPTPVREDERGKGTTSSGSGFPKELPKVLKLLNKKEETGEGGI